MAVMSCAVQVVLSADFSMQCTGRHMDGLTIGKVDIDGETVE